MTHNRLDFASLMRERGFRATPQRQMILDAICDGQGHTTPEQIYQRVRAAAPAVNRATIYRTLDFLCELRLVVAIRVGDLTYYEIAGDEPHHHLVCRTCGRMTQVDHAMVASFVEAIDRMHHFRIDMDHLGLFGLCEKCRPAEDTR